MNKRAARTMVTAKILSMLCRRMISSQSTAYFGPGVRGCLQNKQKEYVVQPISAKTFHFDQKNLTTSWSQTGGAATLQALSQFGPRLYIALARRSITVYSRSGGHGGSRQADKRPPAKDFGAMNEAKWCELNNAIHSNLFESATDATYDITPEQMQKEQGVDAALDYMDKSIAKAVEKVVPAKVKGTQIKRRVSDTTRSLYEKRANIFSTIAASGRKVKRSLRRRWNKRIRDANLAD